MATHIKLKKRLLKLLLLLSILFKTSLGVAQNPPVNEPVNNLPKIFFGLSDSIKIEMSAFTNLFLKKGGESVVINLGNELVFDGTVQDNYTSYDNKLQTVTIKTILPYPLLITFSKVQIADDKIIYRSLITGRSIGDYIELILDKGQYKFIKKDINRLRAE